MLPQSEPDSAEPGQDGEGWDPVFHSLTSAHYQMLVRTALRHMGPRLLAVLDPAEIVHLVLVELMEDCRIGKLKDRNVAVLRSLALMRIERTIQGEGRRLKRQCERLRTMDLSEEHWGLAVRASGIGSDAGLARLLKWILDQFDATARRTLELHFQGRIPREIAYELGISKDAVYKRLRRALKRIHALLDDAPLT